MLPAKILLFGSRGQVGWELHRALSLLGDVVAADRPAADLRYPDEFARILDAQAPDVIVNAAAYTAVDKAETDEEAARLVNVTAVERLARAARAHEALFVHYSTDYVFDGTKSGAYSESDPVKPASVYGRTKNEGDEAIFASGCDHLVFRTSWVHSSRGNNFIRKILSLATDKDDLAVVADQIGAPTAAEMIADITALAVARQISGSALPSGLYNLTSSGATSWYGFARFIVSEANLLGYQLRTRAESIRPISSAEFQAAAIRPKNSLLDNSKLSSALNIVVPDWSYHARRTIREIRGQ